MAKYEELRAALDAIAKQEAALREDRKALEHEFAQAKADRPYEGPVFDADGNPISTDIEGATATASADGRS